MSKQSGIWVTPAAYVAYIQYDYPTPYPQTIQIQNVVPLQTTLYVFLHEQTHQSATWEGWQSHVTQQSEPRYWHKADGVPVSLPGNRQGTISQSVGRACYLSLLLSLKEDWCMMITRTRRTCIRIYLWLWSFTPPLCSISAATASGIMREAGRRQMIRLLFNELCVVCAACGIPYLYPCVARP